MNQPTTSVAVLPPSKGKGPSKSSKSRQSWSNVDIGLARRGIWLVKVPNYLAARWKRISENDEAGKLKIYTSGDGEKPKVVLSLSDATLCAKEDGEDDIPKEHDLIPAALTNQTVAAFDCESGTNQDKETDKISVLGTVSKKIECRPRYDANYIRLKKKAIQLASKPVHEVKQLDRFVQCYKPVSDHKHNREYKEQKKATSKKTRDDKDKVLELLYAAFEKHQYYNVKDLVYITKQPIVYLKEILKEVCDYCVKSPHKNMWQLKPEFRHY